MAEPATSYDTSAGRLATVLAAPGKTFESIARHPTWVLALVLQVVAAIGVGVAVHQRTDYYEVVEKAMTARGAQVGQADVEQAAAIPERFGAAFAVVGGVFAGGFAALFALIFFVVLRLAGSEISFPQTFSVYLYGAVPILIYSALAAVVVLAGGDLSYEQLGNHDFLASHLAFLAPADAGPVLRAALVGIDFFAIWTAVLWAIGFRIAGRVSPAVAWATAIAIFLLGVGVRAGFAAMGAGGG
jgi:hypothetical protein